MRTPDFQGIAGRAWSLDIPALYVKHNAAPEQHNTPGIWVIDAPGSHPIWWWYRLILINLKDIPGMPPPVIYLEGATHEFILHALDPAHYPPDVEDVPNNYLKPANFGAQMVCPSDEAAIKVIETQAIQPICNGWLFPDTDFTSQWVGIFGDSMMRDKGRW